MGIKHRTDSGFRKFRDHSKLSVCGQLRSSEMPNVSYPRSSDCLKTFNYC
jgi:hypothetical protein